ncbi:hypothetical protein Pta02_77090 [Planobispora takensis]|uniref:Uncharacterized protein n=1 Tax=Planobispora takensis TaxID=1367882 RepID=A0A8J3T781_9ACTN|nr:hypothetical protein Pta02_77090 [Planobispora takensis]
MPWRCGPWPESVLPSGTYDAPYLDRLHRRDRGGPEGFSGVEIATGTTWYGRQAGEVTSHHITINRKDRAPYGRQGALKRRSSRVMRSSRATAPETPASRIP